MSAYIVVELTVKDKEARERYSAAAAVILKEFGGEFIAGGPWEVLYGDEAFVGGTIIKFAERESALSFYNSPKYQATLADRELAIDCRFRLIS